MRSLAVAIAAIAQLYVLSGQRGAVGSLIDQHGELGFIAEHLHSGNVGEGRQLGEHVEVGAARRPGAEDAVIRREIKVSLERKRHRGVEESRKRVNGDKMSNKNAKNYPHGPHCERRSGPTAATALPSHRCAVNDVQRQAAQVLAIRLMMLRSQESEI